MLNFIWNPTKAEQNRQKHGVSFNEASTVFGDPLSIVVYDPDHSVEEDRYIVVGSSEQGRFLMVAYTERDDRIRIISARPLTRAERKAYGRRA